MTNGYVGKEPPVLPPNMVILTNTHAGMKSFHVDTVVALLPRVQFRDPWAYEKWVNLVGMTGNWLHAVFSGSSNPVQVDF